MTQITRRTFLATAAAGTAAVFLRGIPSGMAAVQQQGASALPDLAVVKGENSYDATVRAVSLLGGMQHFVSRGARVGLLINSRFDKPGTFAKPQIALAVAAMCMEAGANELVSLEGAPASFWRRATLSKEHADLIRSIKNPAGHIEVPVKGGTRLKSVEIVRDVRECDVIINIPIFKDHEGVGMTGSLKNIMGMTSGSSNRFFHQAADGGYYSNPAFLAECIAEANLAYVPVLCIGDGTEFIVTNGPFGPGTIERRRTVIAGADRVAVDTLGASLLQRNPRDIATTVHAAGLKIGRMDVDAMTVSRVTL